MWKDQAKTNLHQSSLEWWHYGIGAAVLLLALLMFCQAISHLAGSMLAQNTAPLSGLS